MRSVELTFANYELTYSWQRLPWIYQWKDNKNYNIHNLHEKPCFLPLLLYSYFISCSIVVSFWWCPFCVSGSVLVPGPDPAWIFYGVPSPQLKDPANAKPPVQAHLKKLAGFSWILWSEKGNLRWTYKMTSWTWVGFLSNKYGWNMFWVHNSWYFLLSRMIWFKYRAHTTLHIINTKQKKKKIKIVLLSSNYKV